VLDEIRLEDLIQVGRLVTDEGAQQAQGLSTMLSLHHQSINRDKQVLLLDRRQSSRFHDKSFPFG
jgi:hypothetical protein